MIESESERERADDDGMVLPPSRAAASPRQHPVASELLEALARLSASGGERDEQSLRRFAEAVTALRALPGATGAFRAKVASAGGWAALLFSSWRHRQYDWPNESGASRVRRFIAQDLTAARGLAPAAPPAPAAPE